jgi:hypothetical protein
MPKAIPMSSALIFSCFRYTRYPSRKITMHKRRLIAAMGSGTAVTDWSSG